MAYVGTICGFEWTAAYSLLFKIDASTDPCDSISCTTANTYIPPPPLPSQVRGQDPFQQYTPAEFKAPY